MPVCSWGGKKVWGSWAEKTKGLSSRLTPEKYYKVTGALNCLALNLRNYGERDEWGLKKSTFQGCTSF
jgi:hypothetical protein